MGKLPSHMHSHLNSLQPRTYVLDQEDDDRKRGRGNFFSCLQANKSTHNIIINSILYSDQTENRWIKVLNSHRDRIKCERVPSINHHYFQLEILLSFPD